MTVFDNRDKAFENKYAHDEEMLFKINARRTKLVGLWAAEKCGKTGADAEQFAKDLLESSVGNKNEQAIIEKLQISFSDAGAEVSLKEIRTEMENMLQKARQDLTGDKK